MDQPILPLYGNPNANLIKAQGCYLFTSDGKRYLDLEAGVWCANLGHSHPAVVRTLRTQASVAIHHGYAFRNEWADRLGRELNRLVGFPGGQSVFLSSGSEAMTLALNLAFQVTGRQRLVKVDHSFLSAYGPGQLGADNPAVFNVRLDDLGSLDQVAWDEAAAVVLEVGGASVDLVRVPSQAFIRALVDRGRSHGCLVIADEVTTGLGRMGTWFGYHPYGVSPDLVVTGKALGNGYPISGVTVTEAVAQRLGPTPKRYAQSHQNDPLGCAVALAVLGALESERLVDRAEVMGRYVREALDLLKERRSDQVREVRGRGLMLAVELHEKVPSDRIRTRLFEEGFVVGGRGATFRILPPLTIAGAQVDKFVRALYRSFGSAITRT